MKRYTSTDRYAWWYDANYKCMHQLHAIDFLYMLKEVEENPARFPDLLEFVQELARISYGIPGYLLFHPKSDLFCAVERVSQMAPFPPNIDNFPQLYASIEKSIRKTQKYIDSAEIELRIQVEWRNKIYNCPHEVHFEDLYNVLDDWEADRADFNDVFGFAEGLSFIGGGYPFYPEDDPRYVIVNILGYLDMGYSYPILKEDIPAMKEYLISGQDSPQNAWKKFESYLNSLDIRSRFSHYLNKGSQDE